MGEILSRSLDLLPTGLRRRLAERREHDRTVEVMRKGDKIELRERATDRTRSLFDWGGSASIEFAADEARHIGKLLIDAADHPEKFKPKDDGGFLAPPKLVREIVRLQKTERRARRRKSRVRKRRRG